MTESFAELFEQSLANQRIRPGQILAVDTETGQILDTDAIDNRLKSRHPYKQWLRKNALRIQATMEDNDHGSAFYDVDQLKQYMKMYQVTFEERDQVLRPLGEQGYEAVGSMGDDTPMAVLSQRVRTPYDYFRQQFAQVTNPPIDPLREAIVMSLEICLGAERNIFQESPEHASRVILSSPVISPAKWRSLMNLDRPGFERQKIDLNYDESVGLEAAIRNVADQAEEAVRAGRTQIVLSDRHIAPGKLPIHASLATGAVHEQLGLIQDAGHIDALVQTWSRPSSHDRLNRVQAFKSRLDPAPQRRQQEDASVDEFDPPPKKQGWIDEPELNQQESAEKSRRRERTRIVPREQRSGRAPTETLLVPARKPGQQARGEGVTAPTLKTTAQTKTPSNSGPAQPTPPSSIRVRKEPVDLVQKKRMSGVQTIAEAQRKKGVPGSTLLDLSESQ